MEFTGGVGPGTTGAVAGSRWSFVRALPVAMLRPLRPARGPAAIVHWRGGVTRPPGRFESGASRDWTLDRARCFTYPNVPARGPTGPDAG